MPIDRQAAAMEKIADETKKQTKIFEALNENLVALVKRIPEVQELVELKNESTGACSTLPVRMFGEDLPVGQAEIHADGGISIFIDGNVLVENLSALTELGQVVSLFIGVEYKELKDSNARS